MRFYPNSASARLLREYNPHHEPAGSSKGGRFAHKPGGTTLARFEGEGGPSLPGTSADTRADGGEPPAPPVRDRTAPVVHGPLATGTITEVEPLDPDENSNTNQVAFVTFEDGTKAAYKPETGEVWDNPGFTNFDIPQAIQGNPAFSLAEREAAAYEVDQLLGTDLVPETVLRETVELPEGTALSGGIESGGYDRDELQRMYDDWREGQMDAAMERVGEQMFEGYNQELGEKQQQVEEANEGIEALLDEVKAEVGYEDPYEKYGQDIDEQPLLQDVDPNNRWQGEEMVAFDARAIGGKVLDPLRILSEADISLDELGRNGELTPAQEDRVKNVLRAQLAQGYGVLGDVDVEKVGDAYPYDEWLQNHEDTEGRLLDRAVASYDLWKQRYGYEERGGNAPGGVKNPDAPHPNGGSLQRFIEHGQPLTDRWGEEVFPVSAEDRYRFAVLDYALGAMDRHPRNWMVGDSIGGGQEPPQRIYAIDHGFTFPNDNTVQFRSYPASQMLHRYDLDQRDIPHVSAPQGEFPSIRDLRLRTLANVQRADWDGFLARHPAMSAEERDAFRVRVGALEEALRSPFGLERLWKRQNHMDR